MVIYKILRFIRQNRIKFAGLIIFIIFVYTMILTANNAYKRQGAEEVANSKNKIVTIEAEPTVNLSNKNCEKIINTFLNNCTKGNYEEAYSYLSDDCKQYLYTSVDDFKKNYCIPKSIKGKGYSLEKVKDISDYTYRIAFNNMLSSGKVNTELTYDYYSITVDNGHDIRLNINSYLKTKDIELKKEVNNLEINVQHINVFTDYQEVVVTFNNNSKNTISIGNNIYITDKNGKRTKQLNEKSEIIEPEEELTINYKFNKNPELNLNKIIIENLEFNYNLDNEEKQNIEIDL